MSGRIDHAFPYDDHLSGILQDHLAQYYGMYNDVAMLVNQNA